MDEIDRGSSEIRVRYAQWLLERGLADWQAAYLVWICPHCNNHGFEYETECCKCRRQRAIN